MTTETTRADIRVTANDQNIWTTGDAFLVEWSEYVPLLGGEMIEYEVVSVTQPEIGRVTFEGDELTWEAAGATITAPRSIEIDYRVRDDDGEESDLFVTLDLENTLQGLEVSEEDSGSGIGSLTFDAVLIEDRLQDRETLTLDEFIDFDLDLDARAALEKSGVLGTLRAARDRAQADLETANADLRRETAEASAAADAFADTATAWGLTAANDVARTFATATFAAAAAVNVVSDAAKSGLATTYSDVIETLNGRITFLWAERDVFLAREVSAIAVYNQFVDLYNFSNFNGALKDEMPAAVVDAVNTLIERGDLRGVGTASNGDAYEDLLPVMDDILRYREEVAEAARTLSAQADATIEARNDVIAEYEDLNFVEKLIFGYVDFVNGLVEGGLDALTTTVTEIDRLAKGTAAETQTALDRNGSTATIGDVLSDFGDVLAEGAEAGLAIGSAATAEIALGATQATLDAATAIGDGNKLKFDLEIDAAASAQAGLVMELRLDGGSVDSNLDYALTSVSDYDATADTFTIRPTAIDATSGEAVAFSTISPNASFFLGLAYFTDVTLDIATEYFGRAIGFDLFDSEGRQTLREYFSTGGIFEIVDIDTANLAEAGILPDLPVAAFQLPEFNDDNQLTIEFGNWVDDVITELSFGVPIIETEGKAAPFSPEFYADETNVEENLRKILADFANAQLGFSEEFKTLLEENGSSTEFDEADFFAVIETIFDSITAADGIADDGFIPIIELSIGSDTALFHIDTFPDDLSGLDLSGVGSLGFFTSAGSSSELVRVEIDVDTLAVVAVGQLFGIPPETSVDLNPLQQGWSLEDIVDEADLTPEQKAVVNESVAVEFSLDTADLKIGAGALFDQEFALRVDDMEYRVTFEDGTTQRVDASDAEALVITDASRLEDVNGDGEIDYTLTLTPDAEFFNDTELRLALDYALDILKAKLELGLSLPLSAIPDLGLTDIDVYELNLALGPLFRASAELDLLTLDIFEDRFDFEAGSGSVSGSVTLPPAERGSTDPDELSGSEGDDLILGLAGADDLMGLEGDDTLDGGSGPDTMTGGTGDDTYVWDDRKDRVVEAAGGGVDRVEATANVSLRRAEIEEVELRGDGDFRVIGNGTAQTITGNGGANVLVGGGGGDTLTGGAGPDIFAFTVDDAPGVTVIADFEPGDLIALDDRFFGLGDAGIDPREVTAPQYRGALRTGQATYDPKTGDLSIDLDGPDGPADPVTILRIEGGGRLSVDDFLLF